MIPAEWIRISILLTNLFTSLTASLTDVWDDRSKETKCTVVEGEMEEMAEIKGSSFAFERPVRIRVAGEPEASESAVSAPMEFGEGPVRRTANVSLFSEKDEKGNYSFCPLHGLRMRLPLQRPCLRNSIVSF
jgi:hypothetical protein